MSLDDYLRAQPGRCRSCGVHIATQAALHVGGCYVTGERLRDQGMSAVANARPEDVAKVLAAITKLARTGEPFSANEVRPIHGVSGPAVGAAFGEAKRLRLIKRHGKEYVPSDDPKTHGHPIAVWRGDAA